MCKKVRIDESVDGRIMQYKSGIGGSDIAGVCGISKYSSPKKVYEAKTSDTYAYKDNLPMKVGRMLEQTVADLFTQETGIFVQKSNFMMVHNEYDFFHAHLDRVFFDGFLECKTTSAYNADEWADGKIPPHYYAQVQWYLGITGYKKAYIACLIGNQEFVIREVVPDEDYIKNLQNTALAFWTENVQKGVCPAPTEVDLESYTSMDRADEVVKLDPSCDALFEEREQLQNEKKGIETRIKEIDANLLNALNGAEVGEGTSYKISCKKEVRTSVDKDKVKELLTEEQFATTLKESVSHPVRVSKIKAKK